MTGRASSDIETTFDSSITMKIPTGGRTTFAWESLRTTAEEAAALPHHPGVSSFTQPLLRGGGVAVGTAGLENARRREESNILAFRSVVMRLVTEVVRSYWNLVTVARRLDISAPLPATGQGAAGGEPAPDPDRPHGRARHHPDRGERRRTGAGPHRSPEPSGCGSPRPAHHSGHRQPHPDTADGAAGHRPGVARRGARHGAGVSSIVRTTGGPC